MFQITKHPTERYVSDNETSHRTLCFRYVRNTLQNIMFQITKHPIERYVSDMLFLLYYKTFWTSSAV